MLSAFLAVFAMAEAEAKPACTAETSTRATIASIGDRFDHWRGRCVTLSGPFTSISLYSSVEGLYLTSRYEIDGNPAPATLRRNRIGIYSRNNRLREIGVGLRKIVPIEVTGRVDSCERMHAEAVAKAKAAGKIPIIMMSGYCHYFSGAVIRVDEYRLGHRAFERLAGERNRERFGNLVPMPESWPQRVVIERDMAEFLTALRSGDVARMAALHREKVETKNAYTRKVFAALLDRSDSVFAEVRLEAGLPVRYFVDRSAFLRWHADGTRPEHPYALACICRTKDCEGRWPISDNDADNKPSRPYACTRLGWEDWKGGTRVFQTADGDSGWLAEPARTAFRPPRR